jgi:WD40 repeat protein
LRPCLALIAFIALNLFGCGGGGGSATGSNDTAAGGPAAEVIPAPVLNSGKGSLVFDYVKTINGKLGGAIHVFDLESKTETVFKAIEFLEGGATVAKNGHIAQLAAYNDSVGIRITKLDGSIVKEFTFDESLSFALGGAAISPDASRVAFAINTYVTSRDNRADKVVVCQVANLQCRSYLDLREPAWTADGRLLATNSEQTRIFMSDGALATFSRLGTQSYSRVNALTSTPDSKGILIADKNEIGVFDIASGAYKRFGNNSLGIYDLAISSDGATLFFTQKCCGSADLGIPPSLASLMSMPYKPTADPNLFDRKYQLLLANGTNPVIGGRIGYTDAVR